MRQNIRQIEKAVEIIDNFYMNYVNRNEEDVHTALGRVYNILNNMLAAEVKKEILGVEEK